MFKNILVANRGEIAVRIIRTCRDLGIRTTAVFSDADRDAPHVHLADRSIHLGPSPARDSYLVVERVLAAAREAEADAIHPGYGFLSENADFARAVEQAGLAFIGPSAEAIALMGDKVTARSLAQRSGVPVLPGSDAAIEPRRAAEIAASIGYPLIVKAAGGGGGRGMRVVRKHAELDAAVSSAARESQAAFGRADLFLERLIEHGRHVEVQVVGDRHRHVMHLGDRDCSLQRRHQKLVEEAPAPALDAKLRAALHKAAIHLAHAIGYVGAGTVEFLVDTRESAFWFLEMNTRLQVEHGVTELVTGLDLVELQIRAAAGERLPLQQEAVEFRGHAMQMRITAEDASAGYAPSTGKIAGLQVPTGPWVRADFGVEAGSHVSPHYDSMIGKVIVWGPTRESARVRLIRAVREMDVEGVTTSAAHLAGIMETDVFKDVRHDVGWLEREGSTLLEVSVPPHGQKQQPEAALFHRVLLNTPQGRLDLDRYVPRPVPRAVQGRPREVARGSAAGAQAGGAPVAPIDCTVTKILALAGQSVQQGSVLCLVEAMKMELPVRASASGTVAAVLVAEGASVVAGTVLFEISAAPA